MRDVALTQCQTLILVVTAVLVNPCAVPGCQLSQRCLPTIEVNAVQRAFAFLCFAR